MSPFGFDVWRPSEDGGAHGTQFFGLGGVGRRYDHVMSGGLQAGDTAYHRGHLAPSTPEGASGYWRYAGSDPNFGGGNPGDDYVAPGHDVGRWVWEDRAPQQQAEPQEPYDSAPREAIPAQLDIYDNSPAGWDRFDALARAEREGVNRMPFIYGVGPESGNRFISADPQRAMEQFYPRHMQGWQNYLENPLLSSQTPPAALDSTGQREREGDPRDPRIDPNTGGGWRNPIFNWR